jgi:hypothetical protein
MNAICYFPIRQNISFSIGSSQLSVTNARGVRGMPLPRTPSEDFSLTLHEIRGETAV